MRRSAAFVTLFLLVSAHEVDAQRPSVRFRAHSSLTIRTRFDVRGSIRLVGVRDVPDSALGGYAAFVDETRRATARLGGVAVVQAIFDSSRVQYRPGPDQPWRVLRTPRGPVGPAYYSRDPLLGLSRMDGVDSVAMQTVSGVTGRPEFSLPDSILEAGQRWTGFLKLPYTVGLPDDSSTVLAVRLDGRATFVLDSVVPRSTDTLAYLRVNAGLSPLRSEGSFVTDDTGRTITIWGTVSASLVWSTGWSEWVTGTTSLRMQHHVAPGPTSTSEVTMFSHLVSRFSIRP